jgi:hypothetical protein
MASATPSVARSATHEAVIATRSPYRSLKVFILHRAPHSMTKQHFATEKTSRDEIYEIFRSLNLFKTISINHRIVQSCAKSAAMN